MATAENPRRGFLLALAAIALAPSLAAPAAPATLSPADQALVDKAVAYLQGLTNAKGRFVQVDARGVVSSGDISLHRPGKARFQYDPPSGLVIASDGRMVSILNPRLKSFYNYPLRYTPLSLLLRKDIRLDHGAEVVGVAPMAGGFAITVREGRGRMQGAITLDFSDRPVSLTGWTIVDARGAATKVRLVDFATVGSLDPAIFELHDPRAAAEAQAERETGDTH